MERFLIVVFWVALVSSGAFVGGVRYGYAIKNMQIDVWASGLLMQVEHHIENRRGQCF